MDRRYVRALVVGGVAAILLTGGGASLASWTTTTAVASTHPIATGSLTASGSAQFGTWTYTAADPFKHADGTSVAGDAVTSAVPSDVLSTTVTFTVQGHADHLVVDAAIPAAAFTGPNAANNPTASNEAANITLTVASVTVDGTPVDNSGIDLSNGQPHTVTVVVTAAIGNVPNAVSTATLDSMVFTFAQA